MRSIWPSQYNAFAINVNWISANIWTVYWGNTLAYSIDSWMNIHKFAHTYSRIPNLHSLIPSSWYDNFRVLKIVFHTVHTVRMSWVAMVTSVHRGKKRFCRLIIHINLSLLTRNCELCTARVIIKTVQMMLWINFDNMKTLPRCYMPMLDSCVSTCGY